MRLPKWVISILNGFDSIYIAIMFRLDYNDNIDRCAFFEELNYGWCQMQDEYSMSQPNFDPYNLSGRDPYYSYVMSKK
jgi:hypothetical protein